MYILIYRWMVRVQKMTKDKKKNSKKIMNNKGEKTLLVRDELDFVPKKRIQDHQLLTKHTLTSCFKHLDGESVE